MKGEPINISTLEKKFKEGINDVKDRIKEVDYESTTKKAQNSLQRFFNLLGGFAHMLIKVFGKILGSVLVIIAYVSLFSITIALFSFGLADILSFPFSGIHEFMEFQYWEVPFGLQAFPFSF
jgi:uncharacterized membrane protein